MDSFQDSMSASERDSSLESPREGKLSRIVGHTRGLFEELREWIDLRLDLAIIEIEEEVDDLRNELALGLVLAVLGFFAALFVMTTAALGLGWALGHPFWGFLIISVLLVLVAVGLSKAHPELLGSSNLYERLRSNGEKDGEADRPIRDAEASVDDREEQTPPSTS